jgi:DNA transformation protein and related proteins
MAAKNAYIEWIQEWLAPLGEITVRSMMGGHVVYCNCQTFALLSNNTLYLKADDVTRPKFETLGLKPFQPFTDKPMTMSYYPPPPEFFEDAEVMLLWGREAVAVAQRAKAKRTRPRNKRAARM